MLVRLQALAASGELAVDDWIARIKAMSREVDRRVREQVSERRPGEEA
jgi:hypothetical protein